jgi:predicted small lipoprotein YifL
MDKLIRLTVIAMAIAALSACGDKKDQAQREEAAKQAIQQGMQKEKAMMEGMSKGVENIEKKMTEAKEETKK